MPAIDGWFSTGDQPALSGGRCTECGTFTFPRREGMCPNPHCDGREQDEVALSRRATVWSYATNHYDPPPPAVVQAPYTVVAATLADESMTVLGLLAPDAAVADIRVGTEVEVVLRDLHVDDEGVTRTIWAWAPVAAGEVTS